MKKKVNVAKIYEPIFQAEVRFVWGASAAELKALFKKTKTIVNDQFYDTMDGSVSLIDTEEKDGGKTRDYLVWIRGKKDFYSLMHETLHLVQHILTDRNIPFNAENDETIAYYHTFWFRKLWRVINKKGGGKHGTRTRNGRRRSKHSNGNNTSTSN